MDGFSNSNSETSRRVSCTRCLGLNHDRWACKSRIRCTKCFSLGHARASCLRIKKKWVQKAMTTKAEPNIHWRPKKHLVREDPRKLGNTGQLTEKEYQEFGAAHLDTNSVPSTSANSPDISTLLQDPPLYNKNPPPPPTNQEDPSSSESIDVDADQDQAMANFLVIP